MRKYTYIWKDGKVTISQTRINDANLEENIQYAEDLAKKNGWEVKTVHER